MHEAGEISQKRKISLFALARTVPKAMGRSPMLQADGGLSVPCTARRTRGCNNHRGDDAESPNRFVGNDSPAVGGSLLFFRFLREFRCR